jgi:drug/metabolite transporter (DMT)-like permease
MIPQGHSAFSLNWVVVLAPFVGNCVCLPAFLDHIKQMEYIVISIFCSVIVSVFFKWAKRYGLHSVQMIVWNYPMAVLLTWYFFDPQPFQYTWRKEEWGLFSALGILLPVVFICLGYAVRHAGLVRTEVAQRMSLLIPLMAAFFLFGEQLSWDKGLGLGLGLFAMLLIVTRNSTDLSNKRVTAYWLWPSLVFVGYGIIDVLFKKVAQWSHLPYTTAMWWIFFLAMLFAQIMWWTGVIRSGKSAFSLPSMLAGLLMGAFNFANILFYMKAHRALSDQPSLVFSGMNIGVMVLGTLVGVWIFKEKLNVLAKIGLGLALISVVWLMR